MVVTCFLGAVTKNYACKCEAVVAYREWQKSLKAGSVDDDMKQQ